MRENIPNNKKPAKLIRKDLHLRACILLAVLVIGGFGAAAYGLFRAQIIKGDFFKTKAEIQQLHDADIPAQRGVIYDSNMTVLAKSASVWKISLNAHRFSKVPEKAQEAVYKILGDTLGVSREYLENKAGYTSYNSVVIKTKVEKEPKDKISAFTKQKFKNETGKDEYYANLVMIDDDVKRYYPYSTLAAQLIGFTGTDNEGLSGLEYYYNNTLMGIDGRVISASSNTQNAEAIEYRSVYDAKQGTSLVLTLHETIQRYLEDALSDCYKTSGCKACYGIVMDVKTGAILAMSTQGGFDLNDPHRIFDDKILDEINGIEDEEEHKKQYNNAMYAQWRNRAISDTYEPGSVFKVITMAAGLEENVVQYDEQYTCTGSIDVLDRHYYCYNHSGHGTQTLTEGLMNSCNPYFITIGQRLGVETFYKYFEAFGFTEKTGIDLPGEASPVEGVNYFDKDEMTRVNLASSSFGQSFQVTAIQMLTAVNAIANGGRLMKPYIVGSRLDEKGNIISKTEPLVKRQVISESTSQKILASMEQVSAKGTAKNSYVAGYRVAGKTGTSDKLTSKGECVASFAGVAPADKPEISIIIVVDEPQGVKGGGAVAAPIAGEVLENALTYLNEERQYSESEKELLDKKVPNLVGTEIAAAKSELYQEDLYVKVVGDGDEVVSQMPAYGQYIPQDGVVVLYTEEEEKKAKTEVPDFTGMSVSEVNSVAVNAGINVKIAGNSLSSSNLLAYRQSIPAGSELEYGTTITVFFRTTTGVTDH